MPLVIFRDARLIAKSDSDDLPPGCLGFSVGVAGNIRVTTIAGTDIVIPIAVGTVIYLQITRIWSTNTTATGLVAYY
jgi:hypothetical protein